jgi:hypothetical protein
MAEHTPGYTAALAAALHQANVDALRAAENGNNQLGMAVTKHPGLRLWNGNFVRVGHHPLTPFAVEINPVIPEQLGWYVDKASHEHVHLEHLAPPPGYPDDPTVLTWVHCAADADGAVPITIAVTQTRPDHDPEPR